jgi:hypothetical protein
MKERLVDDWLTRINERGYQTAFGQVLAAQGFNILRIRHSAYEHGKDVLAIAPNGEIHCYQLKDGDIDISTFERHFGQISALVQARPSHPSLPTDYVYRPFLVTNGLFTDPALDRILHHNKGWEEIGFPRLEIHDGRWLHRHFTDLALDFWPTSPPDVRQFRRLYLVDGRGDFDPDTFAEFVRSLFPDDLSRRDLDRHAAAANIFVSYILGEFYRQSDHWSIFRAWTMTAAAIACANERSGGTSAAVTASFTLARDAAHEALSVLATECQGEDAFKPTNLEWDEYTRVRNAVAMGAWATWCLLHPENRESAGACISMSKRFIPDGRLGFWGEGCLSLVCALSWLAEREGECRQAKTLLEGWLQAIVAQQQRHSTTPLPDAYTSPDDALLKIAEMLSDKAPKRPVAVSSHSLLPLVLLFVNRGYRSALETNWKPISRVTVTVFKPDDKAGYLEWRCRNGSETDQSFNQPQSWKELVQLASSPTTEKLPDVLRSDWQYRLMFIMAFPHRQAWSIFGSLDAHFKEARSPETTEESG